LAANSIICYCLRITEIDPVRMDMLVERFISRAMCYRPSTSILSTSRVAARCAGVSHRADSARHLVAQRLEDHSALLGRRATASRDFHCVCASG
jgi:Bacterial DNA polymerase III alpha NTPase domain